jgi:hypothetical protein
MSMSSTTTPATGAPGSPARPDESGGQQAAEAVRQHAGAAASTAKDEAVNVLHSATDHARSVLGKAADELREQGRGRTADMSRMLGEASDEFGRMAETCDSTTPAGRTVRMLADATGQLAGRLERGGPEGMVSEASRFARRRPGTFLALSAAAGFAVGRLARSTDNQTFKHALSQNGDSSSQHGQPSAGERPMTSEVTTADLGDPAAFAVGEVASMPVGGGTTPMPPTSGPGGSSASGGPR